MLVRGETEGLEGCNKLPHACTIKRVSTYILLTGSPPLHTQTQRILDEEECEDTSLHDRFKEKWNRQPSAKLTETMRKEVTKFQSILDAATQADQKVKEKYENNRGAIILLGKPLEELNAAIPKAVAQDPTLSGSQVAWGGGGNGCGVHILPPPVVHKLCLLLDVCCRMFRLGMLAMRV